MVRIPRTQGYGSSVRGGQVIQGQRGLLVRDIDAFNDDLDVLDHTFHYRPLEENYEANDVNFYDTTWELLLILC